MKMRWKATGADAFVVSAGSSKTRRMSVCVVQVGEARWSEIVIGMRNR